MKNLQTLNYTFLKEIVLRDGDGTPPGMTDEVVVYGQAPLRITQTSLSYLTVIIYCYEKV